MQQSFGALGPLYVYFGVGRSNNYIELFTISTVVSGERQLRVWSPIIPNSQLLVLTDRSESPAEWAVELLVSPNKSIGLIIAVDLLFLLVLGLAIIIMHLAEKAEDKRDQIDYFDYF